MGSIYVIGYFGHNNLGDCQYELTFDYIIKKYLENYSVNFIECDKLSNTKFKDTDIILVGGGDILNDYFIDKIIDTFKAKPNKIIAVSVGIPYTSILNTNKLCILDYIFIRTKQDLPILKSHFNSERIMYLPDLSYFLNTMTNNKISKIDSIRTLKTKSNITICNNGSKIITICLSRHIYNEKYKENYNSIVNGIAQYISGLITQNYHIILLPFNTNIGYPDENDILINNDVIFALHNISVSEKVIKSGLDYIMNYTKYMTIIDRLLDAFDVNYILSISHLVIPMRFHACLFSIFNNIPILPLFTTRKIYNLLLDIKWNDYYQMPVNELDIPLSLDINVLMQKTMALESSFIERVSELNYINTFVFGREMTSIIGKLIHIIKTPYDKIYKDQTIVHFVSNSDIIKNLYKKIDKLINYKGYTYLHDISDEKTQDLLVSIVSYHLAGKNINSMYNHGLKYKMFKIDYNYNDEWLWIINDFKSKYKPVTLESNINGLFNINYLDQIDYSGVHRSGWQYVFENISYLHDDNHPLLLDMYLDRTFIWNSEINEILNFIPYKKDWIGFIHHTFDTSFSKNNCYTLFENQLFIKSLKCCKGLFVLSRYLQKQIQDYLVSKKINVKVYYIMHPTDTSVKLFTFKNFVENNDKKILHIGGWLRDTYSFYNVNTTDVKYKKRFTATKKYPINKWVLKGKHMNNYFPETTFLNLFYNTLKSKNNTVEENANISNANVNTFQQLQEPDEDLQYISSCISTGSFSINDINNNWYKCLFTDVKKKIMSVNFINHLSNNEFDEILTKNIVFLNLIDASATNTVIECIVRNTPIIINKHPAIVELLGEPYPLFYENNLEYNEMINVVQSLISNGNAIESASIYLSKIKNDNFSIETFKTKFIQILKSL
jgi:hypothetical protein